MLSIVIGGEDWLTNPVDIQTSLSWRMKKNKTALGGCLDLPIFSAVD